jgi:hypothetical protein
VFLNYLYGGMDEPTVELACSIYARPTKSWHRWNVRRAAPRVAERVRQVRSAGLPVLWKLKWLSKKLLMGNS